MRRSMFVANLPWRVPIGLVALGAVRSMRRRYIITAVLGLVGMIVGETRWGRIGPRGQAQARAFADRAAAKRHIAANLSRRDTAEIRIGVAYRSEEHTSELQSLMRISYAVFCLKNNN